MLYEIYQAVKLLALGIDGFMKRLFRLPEWKGIHYDLQRKTKQRDGINPANSYHWNQQSNS